MNPGDLARVYALTIMPLCLPHLAISFWALHSVWGATSRSLRHGLCDVTSLSRMQGVGKVRKGALNMSSFSQALASFQAPSTDT